MVFNMRETSNQTILLILQLSTFFIQFTESQVDTTGCSFTPLTCLDPTRARNICNGDNDCPIGKKCCYRGCYKSCAPRSPCSNVVCKPGYLCQEVNTPCRSANCIKEASCVPVEKVNCQQQSSYPACSPGYERSKDQFGCRVGPCQAKQPCPFSCRIWCAYGQMEDANGCPICQCKQPPINPCSSLGCSILQECRFMSSPQTSTTVAAIPSARCVSGTLTSSLIDNSCSRRDPTTIGFPILDTSAREIDCAISPCPAHSVCVTISSFMHRCCYQHTQLLITTGPKIGECPPTPMLRYGTKFQTCEIDANCPGTFKCCYVNKARGMTSYVGLCLPPIHVTLSDGQFCQKAGGSIWFYKAIGLC